MGPVNSDEDIAKFKTQTYYVWKHEDIYYLAAFIGMDKLQNDNLKALVLAPAQ